MDVLKAGAEIATMVGGLSVLTAVSLWIRERWHERREQRAARNLRNWHGYIDLGMLSSWYVRLAEVPDTPSARVVLEVLDGPHGDPSVNQAHAMRQRVREDNMLARVPTTGEFAFLKTLRKERGYGKDNDGFPVR